MGFDPGYAIRAELANSRQVAYRRDELTLQQLFDRIDEKLKVQYSRVSREVQPDMAKLVLANCPLPLLYVDERCAPLVPTPWLRSLYGFCRCNTKLNDVLFGDLPDTLQGQLLNAKLTVVTLIDEHNGLLDTLAEMLELEV